MAETITFELQTSLIRGRGPDDRITWKIDSLYDDRETAVEQAQRLHSGGRYSMVRVVEERFDQKTGKVISKVIFRSAKTDKINVKTAKQQKTTDKEVGVGEFKGQDRGKEAPSKSQPGVVVLILVLGGIVLAGIIVILGLRHLFGVS